MAGEGPMMSTQAPTGSVPSQSGGGTINPIEALTKAAMDNSAELSKYALAAATPIPGGSQGHVPGSLNQAQKGVAPGIY